MIYLAVLFYLPLAVYGGVNLINLDTRRCGASADTQQCSNHPAGVCCNKVPHLGIQSVKYSGFDGHLKGVLAYNEDAHFDCGAEQYSALGHAHQGCVDCKGYTVYGGSAWLDCDSFRNCYLADVPPGKRDMDRRDAPDKPLSAKRPRPKFKITESRKPDLFGTGGRYYFINGVMRLEGFDHITPMTEAETEDFITDHLKMTRDELHAKWGRFSVESNAENDAKIHGPEGIQDHSDTEQAEGQ